MLPWLETCFGKPRKIQSKLCKLARQHFRHTALANNANVFRLPTLNANSADPATRMVFAQHHTTRQTARHTHTSQSKAKQSKADRSRNRNTPYAALVKNTTIDDYNTDVYLLYNMYNQSRTKNGKDGRARGHIRNPAEAPTSYQAPGRRQTPTHTQQPTPPRSPFASPVASAAPRYAYPATSDIPHPSPVLQLVPCRIGPAGHAPDLAPVSATHPPRLVGSASARPESHPAPSRPSQPD